MAAAAVNWTTATDQNGLFCMLPHAAWHPANGRLVPARGRTTWP